MEMGASLNVSVLFYHEKMYDMYGYKYRALCTAAATNTAQPELAEEFKH